jgi:lipid A ethanolaminephosphotransferase
MKNQSVVLSLPHFVLIASLLLVGLYQGPLLSFLVAASDFPSLRSALVLLAIIVAQYSTVALFLSVFGSVLRRLLKPLVLCLLIASASALWAIETYGVLIDSSVIESLLRTDVAEMRAYLDSTGLGYGLLYGVMPAIILSLIQIERGPRRLMLPYMAMMSILAVTAIYIAASQWLWYGYEATAFTGRLLPWAFLGSGFSYAKNQLLYAQEPLLLPDAYRVADFTHKQVVVLIIGEAARADHLAYYGYPRETNPFTKFYNPVIFPAGEACATYTLASTACILSYNGSEANWQMPSESLPSYLTRHQVKTIVRTNNSGLPAMHVDDYDTAANRQASCETIPCPEGGDGVLTAHLAEDIQATEAQQIFVMLHLRGSHGPTYWRTYPAHYGVFEPVCKTANIKTCTLSDLHHAYDNSIRYTDQVIADVMQQLSTLPTIDSVLLYVADHGESLGEKGAYLHAMPKSLAPVEQLMVPFMVWMSPGFQAHHGLTREAIVTEQTHPHDFVFHSVMGALGLRGSIYRPEYDIFNMGPLGPQRVARA